MLYNGPLNWNVVKKNQVFHHVYFFLFSILSFLFYRRKKWKEMKRKTKKWKKRNIKLFCAYECFTAPVALQVRWWGEAGAPAQTLLTNGIRLRHLDFKAVIKVSFYLIAVGFDCCRVRLHSRSVWKQWRKPKDKGVCAWLCVCACVWVD